MSSETNVTIDPFKVINLLITGMLNDTLDSANAFKAMKITPQGIYGYKAVDISKAGAKTNLSEEVIISKSEHAGVFNIDILEMFLSRRRRFILLKDAQDGDRPYLRYITFDRSTTCISPDSESEPNCSANLYLILRESYLRDSRLAAEAIQKYGLSEGAKGLDYSARYVIIEDQLSDVIDGYILSLLIGGYTEGSYDNYMNTLYVGNKPITCIAKSDAVIPRSINFMSLGFSYTKSNLFTSAKSEKLVNRMTKLKLALPFPTDNKVARFLGIREMTKGIVIANDCLPEDILNCIYPSGLEVPCKYSFTGSRDILYLSPDILCSTNKGVQLMSLKIVGADSSSTANISSSIEGALSLPYSTYILEGLENCTPAIIEKANKALIFIIDKFSSVYELYQRISANKKLTNIVNNLEAIISPATGYCFEVDRAIKSAIASKDIEYIKSIGFTDLFTLDKTRKSFSNYILNLISHTEGFDNVRISSDMITVSYITEEGPRKKLDPVQLGPNHFIHLLQVLSDHDFYTKLKQQGQDNFMYTDKRGETFRVLCTRTANVYNLTIKKNTYKVSAISSYISDYKKIKEAEGLIFIADNIRKSCFNFNRVIASLVADLATDGEKILLVDNNNAIGINSFDSKQKEYINSVSLQSPSLIYNLVSVIKPDIIIYHNIREKAELTELLKVVPLVKSVIASTRLTTKQTAELQLLGNESSDLYQAYFKAFYQYCQYLCTWVEDKGGTQV